MKLQKTIRAGFVGVVISLLAISLFARAEQGTCRLANDGFENGLEGWVRWGGEDTRTDFDNIRAYEGARFARIWGQSGVSQDIAIETNTRYGVRAEVAVSSSQPLTAGMYGEVKIEWRRIVDKKDDRVGEVFVQFDTEGGRDIKISTNTWELVGFPPRTPPAGATHARVALVTWSAGLVDGCVLFDDIELLCDKKD